MELAAAGEAGDMQAIKELAGRRSSVVRARPPGPMGRLRQLGKSSQPIETKWADLAPVGKIVA
jgi:hypothetical protein